MPEWQITDMTALSINIGDIKMKKHFLILVFLIFGMNVFDQHKFDELRYSKE